MKKLTFLLLIINCFFCQSLFATHFMGAQMSYECLNSCTYRIHHKAYYDCSGGATTLPPAATQVPSISLNPLPLACNNVFLPSISWVFVHNIEITPICPSMQGLTACNGGNIINGVGEGYYYADLDLCNTPLPACNKINVIWSSCCRNGAITSGSASQGIYQEMLLDLTSFPCNNSPIFNEPAVSYICAGEAINLDQGATDIDGDSLIYSIGACYQDANNPVTYSIGYDSLQAMGPSWNINLNSSTGFLALTPNPTGNAGVSEIRINVDEYRNGAFLGRVSRDLQVTVINCINPSPVSFTGVQNLSYGNLITNNSLEACLGANVSFDITAIDTDPLDTLTVLSNLTNLIPNANIIITGINPVTCHVSWNPTSQDLGKTYQVIFTAEDNHCPVNSSAIFQLNLSVKNTCIDYLSYPSNCNDSTGALNITLWHEVPPVQYLWSTGDTTEDISGVPSGIYWIYAVDAVGKIYQDTFVVDAQDISIFSTITQPDCDSKTGSILPLFSGGTPPFTYSWNNGSTAPALANIPAGGYTLYVTDANNCVKHETYILDEPDSCIVTISGKAYLDLNANCTFDATDYPLANAFIDATPGGAVFTDSLGDYTIVVDTGNVSIAYNNPIHPPSTCSPGNVHTFTLNSYNDDKIGIDFPIDTIVIQDLKIDGLSSGNFVGGQNHSYLLTYTNTGTVPMSGAVTLIHDSSVLPISSNPFPIYNALTNTISWNFYNLSPGQSNQITVIGGLPTTTASGLNITTSIAINPISGDFTPGNNSKTWIDLTAQPYDPNTKQVFPSGIGPLGFIQTSDSILEYTIRFQNTGSFPANYVIIQDSIDDNLDISSFSPGVSSHPYTVTAEQDRQLIFTFANIQLPDSTSDPIRSQGFIQFSLKQKPNLPIGTQIHNQADIIFDFNPPITTNEVVNTIFTYPMVDIIEPQADTLCEDDFLTAVILAEGMPPYTYKWMPLNRNNKTSALMDSIGVTQTDLYSVVLVDSFGFSDTASIYRPVINHPIADFSTSINQLQVDFTSFSERETGLIWKFGDGLESTGQNPSHTYPKSGKYEVQLISLGDCQNDTSVKEIEVFSGNNNQGFLSSIQIAPNPFSSSFTISFYNPDLVPIAFNLYDARGRKVISREAEPVERIVLDKLNLSTGIYIVELIGNERFVDKVMVK